LLKSLSAVLPKASGIHWNRKLTQRENDIMAHLCRHETDKEIATHLHISETSVRTHLRHIYKKLKVHTREQAAASLSARGDN